VSVQEGRSRSIAVHEAWLPSEHPLHRPRHGGRQRVALVAAVIFFLTPLLVLALGARPAHFENRALAGPPSLRDGWGFFTDLPAWAADRLPFRDAAVGTSDWISRDLFGETALFDSMRPSSAPLVGPVAPPPSVADLRPPSSYPKVIEGKDGWLYFGYDVEGKCAPTRSSDEVISGLQRLRAAVEASGRRFVLVIPPDKSTAVPGHLPDSFAGQECARAQSRQFWQRVTGEAGALDLRKPIAALGSTGVPVYNTLDTHWTDAGSLTMVRSLAEQIRPGVSERWRAEPGQQRETPADLPRLLGHTGADRVRMYSLAPDGKTDRARPYIADMRTPTRIASRPGQGMVNTPVALVGDSFTLPASRYLAATFSDLTVIAYGTTSTDVDTVADTMARGDVVVLEVVERNLAGGLPTLFDDTAIDRISEVLKARPVK
jgi:hypothetical protein